MRCALFSKSNLWSKRLFKKLEEELPDIDWVFCCNQQSYKIFEKDDISWAFFFHWGHLVPESIYNKERCVVLHTSNLPEHRGGSPLQNQIIDGVKTSRVNAIKMSNIIDGGAVYGSSEVSLQGNLTDIWLDISEKSLELIKRCVQDSPAPVKQSVFLPVRKRRKTCEIPVEKIKDINSLYDYIRMLDGQGYEHAFVKLGPIKIKLSRAKIVDEETILADALIELKKDENIDNSSTSG